VKKSWLTNKFMKKTANKNKKGVEDLEKIRHSLSHIMAAAVKMIYPTVKFGIGPVIENGFYYDFDFGKEKVDESLLAKIEKIMKDFLNEDLRFKKEIISYQQAKKLFKDQPYKLELIEEYKKEKRQLSIYRTFAGKKEIFVDLCAGPHVSSTKAIKKDCFKLERMAGAYWRGDEKNPMLTRIYGLAFNTKEELENYLNLIEEAKKRDHRVLGQQLDLFSFHEEFGPGLVYWHPKGGLIRMVMENFWREAHLKNGYGIVFTPHIGKSDLWKISGHLGFYRENMYSSMKIDEDEYFIKPMNCPFHIQIYKTKVRSYRDLPLRWAELGTVYRYEKAGVLHGLLRVRGFTQDDAHLICTPEQMPSEIKKVLDFSLYILKSFGFNNFSIYLSTKPKDAIGNNKKWNEATAALEKALKSSKLPYKVDKGGGAFYGPKIDIKVNDALGREWQCSTIQFDFNMPEKFKMEYIDKDGKTKQPYMIHRALMGSLERFFGALIEHYAGAFPFWLAPFQIKLLPVSDKFIHFAYQLKEKFEEHNFRVEIDDSNETISKRIRNAELEKIPYIIVIGQKEMESGKLPIREKNDPEIKLISVDKFIEICRQQVPKPEKIY
jgi:threonyl-tRNA synthetase